MNYEIRMLESNRLIMKKGQKEDYLKVYEYNFKKLMDVDDIFILEKQDLSKIESWFKGGIKKYYEKLKKANMYDWIIYLGDEAIGNILTSNLKYDKTFVEITVNIHPKYWGKGYMPEALNVVMDYLYSVGYENIICGYLDGNKKAKRVLDKLGFKAYEIEEDAYISEKGNKIDQFNMIMNKDDWFSKTGKINIIK